MNIVIVGAGNGGTSILKAFNGICGFNVLGICDTNQSAPGIQAARELGIRTSDSIPDLLKMRGIDAILEATGSAKVRKVIEAHRPPEVVVVDSHAANIMMTLVESREGMIQALQQEARTIAASAEALSNATHQIEDLVNEMAAVADTMAAKEERLLATMDDVGQHITNTGQILDFAKNIAQATKMLGLNAAIEAARAGQYGRGFSVVANEVQKLAGDSTESVKQINEILSNIEAAAKAVAGEMEQAATISRQQKDTTHAVVSRIEALQVTLDDMTRGLESLAGRLVAIK